MKNSCKKEKGITLMSLVITIVILLILASIATYSGIEVIKSSKLTKFTTEMKIMQTQVNELYQRMQDGDKTIKELGKSISKVDNQTQVNKVFNAVGITTTEEREEYRYFDIDTIKQLNIEGVAGTFLVNIEKRKVISYEGFQYEDKYYYTLDQLPNGLYDVEHEEKTTNEPTFDTNVEEVSEGKWRITVSNINYDGYINKWSVKYKLEGSDNWSTSEDLSFIVNERGNYLVKIENNNIESEIKQKSIYENYIQEGMVLYLDGIHNTRKGHSNETKIWEDLSGNKYDYSLNNVDIEEDSIVFNGTSTSYAENTKNVTEIFGTKLYDSRTMEIVVKPTNLNSSVILTGGKISQKAFGIYYGKLILTCIQYEEMLNLNNYTNLSSYSIVYKNEDIEGYQNSNKLSKSTEQQNWLVTTNDSHIGKRDTGYNSYKGEVMAVRVYNRVLTDEEIKHNYELDKARFKIE